MSAEGASHTGRVASAWAAWLAAAGLAGWATLTAVDHAGRLAGGWGLSATIAAGAVATCGIGAIVAAKTGNAGGGLLAGGGLALAAGLAGGQAVVRACPDAGTGSVAVAAVGPVMWAACLAAAVAIYPFAGPSAIGERGLGGRWILAGPASALVGAAAVAVGVALEPAVAVGHGVCEGILPLGAAPATVVVGLALLGAGIVACLAIAWRRERRVSGSERRQLLPVLVAATAAMALFALTAALPDAARPSAGDRPLVVAAWLVAGVGVALAVTVSVVRDHAFGIFRFAGFMADYYLWTAGLALGAAGIAIAAAWGVAVVTGIADAPAAVAAIALAAGAAAFPVWRAWQARVDARYGQRQEDPAAALERFAARIREDDRPGLRGPVFDLLRDFAPLVVAEGEAGMRFAVPTRDREVGRHTFVHGAYDPEAMRCAMELLAAERGTDVAAVLAGGAVLDVGANIGTSVVPLLRLYGADRGVAIEPAPGNAELLRLNLALNGLAERVTVLAMGLSDRDGELELELSPENPGDDRLRVPGTQLDAEEAARETVRVEVRRFDTLVERRTLDPDVLTLAWLDVQGHEGHVLSGARTLLESDVPVVTEFWPSTMGRMGGLRPFTELVAAHFSRAIDLRRTLAEGRAAEVPVTALDELAERYADTTTFTDLLLLR